MTSIPPIPLGASLRRWRIVNRTKQSALAAYFDVSQGTVARWEAGEIAPSGKHGARLRALLTARPNAASDRTLVGLIESSVIPCHLICDVTHRLLAASPSRAAQWRISADELTGRTLWRFATEDIVTAEAGLGDAGWFDDSPPAVTVETQRRAYAELTIEAGRLQYVRFPLSDGTHARLVSDVQAINPA